MQPLQGVSIGGTKQGEPRFGFTGAVRGRSRVGGQERFAATATDRLKEDRMEDRTDLDKKARCGLRTVGVVALRGENLCAIARLVDVENLRSFRVARSSGQPRRQASRSLPVECSDCEFAVNCQL